MTCNIGQWLSIADGDDLNVLITMAIATIAVAITLLYYCLFFDFNGRTPDFLCADALCVDMIAKGTLALFL